MASTHQERFYANVLVLLKSLSYAVGQLPKGSYDDSIINEQTLGAAIVLLERVDDYNLLIEGFIDRSQAAWPYIYDNQDPVQRAENIEIMRSKLPAFLGELPEEIVGELKKLTLAKNSRGEYIIGEAIIDKIYSICRLLLRSCLVHLEKTSSQRSPARKTMIPFKSGMLTYNSVILLDSKHGPIDIGLWRTLFPETKK
jgi:hypothetical protein